MAAKNETLERTYTIPLRKEFRKVPRWRKTKKAVSALRQFLTRHMKSEDVRLGKALNEKVWQHGAKNPPHKVKVTATKDKDGVVRAELFGAKVEEKKAPIKKKAAAKKDVEQAVEAAQEKPVEKKVEAPKAEETVEKKAAVDAKKE